ncbi:alpha/beta fold hydrolase [Dyella amyloliquefaciens]|uniref:alpha/beta fold hydrolase n=1 Tax=Dyella amyloliquefaciens TaxID=1770545 RepID=UPI0013EE7E50|nr:alpha/beta hydrolase [Dyella amyloliquefaciens]
MIATSFASGRAANDRIALKEYTHPHLLVEVDPGRHLNVFCTGSGSPTVVFEAGGGDDSASFRSVQLGISKFTRVCAYDRAGIGFSDPAPWPSTAVNTVADLHRLVRIISPSQPAIFVGHSDGGLYVSLYASTYPEDVAGLVLIDPFTVGADKVASAVLTRRQRDAWYASDNRDIADARKCLELARTGVLARPEGKTSSCLDNPASPDNARHKILNEQLARASEQSALLSALVDTYPAPDHGMSAAELALQKANSNFGMTPLVVLTAGKDEQTALPRQTRIAIASAWKKNNDELAARSGRGKNIVVPNTHHYIQEEQPDAVIDAVHQVIVEVRGRAESPSRH